MNRTISYFLGDAARQVGILSFDMQGARQSAGFEYHPTWLEADDAFAIEPNLPCSRESIGRDERIRTSDPLHPMQVRYQAAPRPD